MGLIAISVESHKVSKDLESPSTQISKGVHYELYPEDIFFSSSFLCAEHTEGLILQRAFDDSRKRFLWLKLHKSIKMLMAKRHSNCFIMSFDEHYSDIADNVMLLTVLYTLHRSLTTAVESVVEPRNIAVYLHSQKLYLHSISCASFNKQRYYTVQQLIV